MRQTRMTMVRSRLGSAALIGFLVSGVSALPRPVAAAPAPTAALPLHECRLEHPLRLASIPARCGELEVPEDRTPRSTTGAAANAGIDATGKAAGATNRPDDSIKPHATIKLSVAVVPALNRRANAAPLFLLAGGPGQAATAMYASYPSAFARVNRNHDIVLVDQRGTGNSAPLTCDYPDDWQSTAEAMPALRAATEACLKKYGDRVRFFTTSAAVIDLDAVRKALGYLSIDLYGVSYGTRVAQLYMRRFAHSVHAVILDGVTYPEQAIGPDTPQDGERALELIVKRCQEASDCRAAYPDLQRDLDGLRARFGPEVETITLNDPSSGLPRKIEFNRSMLNASLRFLSYSATEASLLPTLIHEAAQGTLAPLAAQAIITARQIGDQLASGMQNSVVCSEDVPFFTAADLGRVRDSKTYQGADQLEALQEICKLWPRGTPVDADLHSPLHSDIPTLLLSGEADPVTPPADAEHAARGLTHHRLLVLSGEGHGQVATACVPHLMADFLDSASAESLDASCLQRHRSAPFFVNTTGPAP